MAVRWQPIPADSCKLKIRAKLGAAMEVSFFAILAHLESSFAAISLVGWHSYFHWILVLLLTPSVAVIAWFVWYSGALEHPDRD
jgi:hypothetical protein